MEYGQSYGMIISMFEDHAKIGGREAVRTLSDIARNEIFYYFYIFTWYNHTSGLDYLGGGIVQRRELAILRIGC